MEHYGFFNGDQEYGQEEFNRYFDNIYESGVSLNDDGNLTLRVFSDNSNNIKVDTGFAIIKGFYLYNDSCKEFNLSRDTYYSRIDRIVVRLNLNNKTVTLQYKTGNAGTNPIPPTLQRDSSIYELSLAQIYIPVQDDIKIIDERFRNELCGAIRPKNISEFNDMIRQFQTNFDKWFNNQQSKGWRNVYIQPDNPQEGVQGSIWIKTL